jgi:phosphatidylglycerol:prolipoprotein diacylglycerol transferase
MLAEFTFPIIDPIALQIGPIAIRWYSIAYITGLLLGWQFCLILARRGPLNLEPKKFEDLLVYATLGIILGGRLGYVLFYSPAFFFQNPLEILMIWHGGMSFHGGFLGVVLASFMFARRNGVPTLELADILACVAPIGLFFGRIANFINSELYGRVTTVSWGIIFPSGGPFPRHPSQLYEAALEGLLLFIFLTLIMFLTKARFFPGLILGLFLLGYGLTRSFAELFREPDAHLGFILGDITMGQFLSAPMILTGIYFLCKAIPRNNKGQ